MKGDNDDEEDVRRESVQLGSTKLSKQDESMIQMVVLGEGSSDAHLVDLDLVKQNSKTVCDIKTDFMFVHVRKAK